MLRGMTAYATATTSWRLGTLSIELSSLNRRHFELRTTLPPHLFFLEPHLRLQIHDAIGRGSLTLILKVHYSSTSPLQLKPNWPLMHHLKKLAQQTVDLLQISRDTAYQILLRNQTALCMDQELEHAQEHLQATQEAVAQALANLMEMKQAEGFAIGADMEQRLQVLLKLHASMTERMPLVFAAHYNQLKEKLETLIGSHVEPDRILREATAYADKGDVSEELMRIAHHVQSLQNTLSSPELISSKVIEFRLQELQREVNTVGSKAGGDLALCELVIAAKSEIEKIREQIQNVE